MDALVLVFGEVVALRVADGTSKCVELAVGFFHRTTQPVQGPATFTFGF